MTKNIQRAAEKMKKINITVAGPTEFLSQFTESLKVVQRRPLSFDPWEVAVLERKEVHNTAVLA